MEKDPRSVKARIKTQKELVIEQLKKTPIVQLACEKVGIARATYYRWKKADSRFRKASEEALLEGAKLINDMAESQLLSAIRDRNMTAIIFWLKHNHPTYETRVEIRQAMGRGDENLTKKQKESVERALKLIGSGKNYNLEKGVSDEKFS